MAKLKPAKSGTEKLPKTSRQVEVGSMNHHAKVPLDGKSLLKMHISHAIMQHLMKIK